MMAVNDARGKRDADAVEGDDGAVALAVDLRGISRRATAGAMAAVLR
jgi:hypothetical protein